MNKKNEKLIRIQGIFVQPHEDMKMLEEFSKEGWILKDIKDGLYYRLIKAKSRDLRYSTILKVDLRENLEKSLEKNGYEKICEVGGYYIYQSKLEGKNLLEKTESKFESYKHTGKQMVAIALIFFMVVAVLAKFRSKISGTLGTTLYWIIFSIPALILFCTLLSSVGAIMSLLRMDKRDRKIRDHREKFGYEDEEDEGIGGEDFSQDKEETFEEREGQENSGGDFKKNIKEQKEASPDKKTDEDDPFKDLFS